jgi:hypothetical protein
MDGRRASVAPRINVEDSQQADFAKSESDEAVNPGAKWVSKPVE